MKTNRILLHFLFYLMLVGLISCEKHQFSTEVFYEQTACADRWKDETSDAETIRNMADYLDKNNIEIKETRLVAEKQPDLCYACNCKTGRIFYGKSAKAT